MTTTTATYRPNVSPLIFLNIVICVICCFFELIFWSLLASDTLWNVFINMVLTLPGLVVVALVGIPFAIYTYIQSLSYLTVNDHEIVYREGWLNISTMTLRFDNICSCSLSSGIIQRMFNASTIVINTANGSDIVFSDIRNGEALYAYINSMIRS